MSELFQSMSAGSRISCTLSYTYDYSISPIFCTLPKAANGVTSCTTIQDVRADVHVEFGCSRLESHQLQHVVLGTTSQYIGIGESGTVGPIEMPLGKLDKVGTLINPQVSSR